ncbi:stemmadenine O-acetyltransferase-like [Salvia miltiorrhiza]|uniref:stemmadenine O-acetyltransferase-like n=1 Tax=Salvia miltiorrhiza TaxID=226208 RepID=UPI0025ABB8BD|nr:stemmadenine O-acetyltransferase-like [Salvia miltiorrhiza]
MEREIISSESVKPSCPTPQNLRRYKFSMLDQIFPPMPNPCVVYFRCTAQLINDPDSFTSHLTEQLKRSLSVMLTRFYPLAGRASGEGEFIDCNDDGVPFTVARFRGHKLSELLTSPRPDLLLPCGLDWGTKPGPGSAVALIQVSCFDCGGFAIGLVFWHKVVDAVTLLVFLRSWAATARGGKEPVCPNYIAQDMFPQKEQMPVQLGSAADIAKIGKSIVRRYVFYSSAISSLKSKVSDVERPSPVEVVSALIWKCFMSASLANGKSTSLLTQTLDLRRRARPPFPAECFGNFLTLAPATSNNNENAELGALVRKMRDSISKVDDDYINRMRGDRGLMGYYENLQLLWTEYSQEFDFLPISSVCGLDAYDVDYGWGKPVWYSKCDISNESEVWNRVWLIDTRNGDGIEAWVILEDKYMSVFDRVEELRALASVDPCPTSHIYRSRF